MNRSILKALYLDAFYQVLDNKVFRLLAILAALLVLPTFLIGAREQGLVFLYGVKTVPWKDIQWLVGGLTNHELIVQRWQMFIVGGLAGVLGVLFSIAATAFFVPRMLEKGAADVVFSKPISRTTLLFARYCAGVLFVAILSTALVLGMHVGLLLVSGTSDSVFLWSIPTIVYVFLLIHSVSLLVGVFTRSSVAALLTTILFFTFNGCIHNGWIVAEHYREVQKLEQDEGDPAAQAAAAADEGLPKVLFALLDTLHFVCPKTTDADLITNKLRKAILDREPLLRDEAAHVSVLDSPAGFEFAGERGQADLATTPARWTHGAEGDPARAELTLKREARVLQGKRRSARTAERNLKATLEKSGVKFLPAERGPRSDEGVRWIENAADGPWERTTGFFTVGEWMYVAEVRQRAGADTSELDTRLHALLKNLHVDEDDPRNPDPAKWYQATLDWTAPWRHNIFFSIGSSLLFAAALFALAAWRLKRIDF